MATRSRTNWKLRGDGQYDCRVGRKINSNGRVDQQRFRLGNDLREAQRRDHLLRQMWERIEQMQTESPLWTGETLELARDVARGESHIQVKRHVSEGDVPYAHRVHQLKVSFPMLAVLPEPDYGAAFGVQLLGAMERMYAGTEAAVGIQQQADASLFRELMADDSLPAMGPTLHEAMRKYIAWLPSEYQHPELGVKPWGRTQIKQVESLIAHHRNLPLSQLDRKAVEQMFQHWRQRPLKRGTKNRVTHKSSLNYLKTLRRFFKWLHSTEEFTWRKPDDFSELGTTVVTLEHEERSQITPEQVFTLDELTLLYRYGQPLDRLLILLGLNCGFGAAESATLRVGEICLNTPHSFRHQEILNFPSTEADSFIKRFRRKNKVYGEFLLFDHTVQGIEWALRRRRKQPDYGQEARVLLNGKGEPYDKPTISGNPNRQIPNSFTRLLDRITADNNEITRLPFKHLRKTGGDLVKRFSDGEIMGVFHSRWKVKETKDDLDDQYANRPFGKVFAALREVECYLQPMFQAAGPEPFKPPAQAYTSRKTIDRIIQLHKDGVEPQQIAEEVGKSVATVQRHITKVTGPRRKGRPKKPR